MRLDAPVPVRGADSAARTYRFRDVDEADLALLRRWLTAPHMAQWWGEPADALEEVREAMRSPSTRAMIVEHDGAPIAYMQHYDPHMEDGHPYRDQPPGTLGLDLSIGPAEQLGRGHGSAMLRRYCEALFDAGTPRVVIDPDPDNARAIRAYEKAGFVAFDTRTTVYGPALMMARDA